MNMGRGIEWPADQRKLKRTFQQYVDRSERIRQPDLLTLPKGPAVIRDADLVEDVPLAGKLHRNFCFAPEPVLADGDSLNNLAPKRLVSGHHIGEVDVRQDVAD